jgi:hypothetical protein
VAREDEVHPSPLALSDYLASPVWWDMLFSAPEFQSSRVCTVNSVCEEISLLDPLATPEERARCESLDLALTLVLSSSASVGLARRLSR